MIKLVIYRIIHMSIKTLITLFRDLIPTLRYYEAKVSRKIDELKKRTK